MNNQKSTVQTGPLGSNTRAMVLSGVFIATSVVLTRFFGFMLFGGIVRLSLGIVPIAMAGAILGPLYGGLVGAIADILGAVLFPQGAYFPGFTLTAFIQGMIPGLVVFKAFADAKTSKKKLSTLIAISMLLTVIIGSLGLNTLWLSILFKKGFLLMLPSRITSSLIVGTINAIVLAGMLNVLKGKI